MNLRKLALACAFVLSMTILSCTAWADNIPIVNASFETLGAPLSITCGTGCAYNLGGIAGWSITGVGGTWQPGSAFASVSNPTLIGYTNATGSLTGSLSQTLTGNSVLANSVYTLSVMVGNRTDGDGGNYTLSLDTIMGGVTTTLCTFTNSANNIASGTFHVEGCSYTSNSTVPSGNLFLQLTSNTGQLDVDNVSLSVQSTSVPEPSSALLSSVGMLFLVATMMVRRKKELQLTA